MIEYIDGVGQDSVAVVQIEAGVVVDGRPADVVSQAVHLDGERQFVTDERIR